MVKIALEMVETVSGMHLEAFESKIITFWVILKPRFGHEKVEFRAFSGKNKVVFCFERVQNDLEMVQNDPLRYLVPLSHFRVPYRLKTTNLSYLFRPKLSLLNCFYWNYFLWFALDCLESEKSWNQKLKPMECFQLYVTIQLGTFHRFQGFTRNSVWPVNEAKYKISQTLYLLILPNVTQIFI